jgi:GNAT superfamily N-acetyltransferase
LSHGGHGSYSVAAPPVDRYNGMVQIELLDPLQASDEDLAARHDLFVAIASEFVPDDEPQPLADFVSWMRIAPAIRRLWVWAIWDDDHRRMLAASWLMFWDEETNRTLARFNVDVRPEFRRQGLAKRLLAPVVETAREQGRTLLDAGTTVGYEAGNEFLKALGGRYVYTGRENALDIDQVDLDLLHRWVNGAKERAAGYRLDGWDAPCPADRVEAFVKAQAIMNDAPTEDFDLEDDVFTVEILRDREASMAARGHDWWVLAAVHEPTGEIAGYTEMVIPSTWPTRAFQGDTGVGPAHRDKGLGRWLKAAMLLRLIDERPAVRRVTTHNAGSNAPMLNINHALGFHCIEERAAYQVPLDVLAERIAAS